MTLRGGATAPSRAIVLAATALLVVVALSASEGRPSRSLLRVSATDGVLASSTDGRAILTVDGIKPGQTESGEVSLTNGGASLQRLTLSSATLVDMAGAGGGLLSERLELTVERVAPDPAVLFTGALADLGPLPAGELQARTRGTYRFAVRLPEGGPAVDDAFKGATTSVTWRWQADSDEDQATTPAPPPPAAPVPVAPADDGWGEARGTGDGPVRLWVGGARQQRIYVKRRNPGFVVLARCSPGCAVEARLSYVRKGRVRALAVRSIGQAGWGQTPKRLVFRFKNRELRLLRSAMRRGIQATLTLRASSPGFGAAVTTRRIKLWR